MLLVLSAVRGLGVSEDVVFGLGEHLPVALLHAAGFLVAFEEGPTDALVFLYEFHHLLLHLCKW